MIDQTFSIGQKSAICGAWRIIQAWREADADKELCKRLIKSVHKRAAAIIAKEGAQVNKADYDWSNYVKWTYTCKMYSIKMLNIMLTRKYALFEQETKERYFFLTPFMYTSLFYRIYKIPFVYISLEKSVFSYQIALTLN